MTFVGMDTKVVRQISSGLGVQANHIGSITSTIQALVGQSMQLWQGQDAVDFSHTWASTRRPMMELLRQHLEEMATAASVNADQQDGASLSTGGSGWAAGAGGATATGRHVAGGSIGPQVCVDPRPPTETAEVRSWSSSMLGLSDNAYQWAAVGSEVGTDPVFTVERHVDHADGFNATVYSYQRADGTTAYVVSFRGSELGWRDWGTNGLGAAGVHTKQYQHAIDLGQEMTEKYGISDVTFTGHSLGGGLAQVASVSTGAPAIVFNAARPGGTDLQMAVDSHSSGAGNGDNITGFSTPDDPLTNIQDNLAGGDPPLGTHVTLQQTHELPWWDQVGMHNPAHIEDLLAGDHSDYWAGERLANRPTF